MRTVVSTALGLVASLALGCGANAGGDASPSPAATASTTTSAGPSSSASGGMELPNGACGAGEGVKVTATMTQPSFQIVSSTCRVTKVATSPKLSVELGCPEMGGGTSKLTMTVDATPPPATTLKIGDVASYVYDANNVDGAETWAAIVDADNQVALGFVDAPSLVPKGASTWAPPYALSAAACTDDASRAKVVFDWGTGTSTIADGDSGTIDDGSGTLVEVERAQIDRRDPTKGSFKIFVARQP